MWRLVVACLAGALSLGCVSTGPSQASETDASTTGMDAATIGDAGDSVCPSDAGPWSPVCPPTACGVVGAPCPASAKGTVCEYGNSWWALGCETLLVCRGTWQEPSSYDSVGCVAAPPSNNPASCPADFTAITSGSDCSSFTDAGYPQQTGVLPPVALYCLYGRGAECDCGYWHGADAGVTWECIPQPGCPRDRPRAGSPCTGNAQCTYRGGCSSYDESCSGGVWTVGASGCP